jgi:GNAT superfamily N-acetyltransferase
MIERHLIIDDPGHCESLWKFYDGIFRPINEETPLVQSFPKNYFMRWLRDSRAVKFVARQDHRIIGLGIVTDEIGLEPLLSPLYFHKHFPKAHLLYCPVVAVAPDHKGRGIAVRIIRAMLNEGQDNTVLVFLHSKRMSLGVPRLFNLCGAGHIEGKEVDVEACWIFRWKRGKKVWFDPITDAA